MDFVIKYIINLLHAIIHISQLLIVHAIKRREISHYISALTDDKRFSPYKRLFSDYAFINVQKITYQSRR